MPHQLHLGAHRQAVGFNQEVNPVPYLAVPFFAPLASLILWDDPACDTDDLLAPKKDGSQGIRTHLNVPLASYPLRVAGEVRIVLPRLSVLLSHRW